MHLRCRLGQALHTTCMCIEAWMWGGFLGITSSGDVRTGSAGSTCGDGCPCSCRFVGLTATRQCLPPHLNSLCTPQGPNGLLAYVETLLETKGHCVICVAEGAGEAMAMLACLGAPHACSTSWCLNLTLILSTKQRKACTWHCHRKLRLMAMVRHAALSMQARSWCMLSRDPLPQTPQVGLLSCWAPSCHCCRMPAPGHHCCFAFMQAFSCSGRGTDKPSAPLFA